MKFDTLFERAVFGASGPAVLPRPGVKPAPTRTAPTTVPGPKRPGWLPTPGVKPRPKAQDLFPDENQEEVSAGNEVAPSAAPVVHHSIPAAHNSSSIAARDAAIYNKRKHKLTITH